MSILCYVTFNDGGSVLKSVCGEWGPMFSPENPDLARSAASMVHPPATRPALRTAPKTLRTPLPTAPTSSSTPTCSPNLFKQIKSTLLFHLTFIWRATPPLSLCFLLLSVSVPQPAALSSFHIWAASSGAHKGKSVHSLKFSNQALY